MAKAIINVRAYRTTYLSLEDVLACTGLHTNLSREKQSRRKEGLHE